MEQNDRKHYCQFELRQNRNNILLVKLVILSLEQQRLGKIQLVLRIVFEAWEKCDLVT